MATFWRTHGRRWISFLWLGTSILAAQDARKGFDRVCWDSKGNLVRLAGGSFARPWGVILDPQGRELQRIEARPPRLPGATMGNLQFVDGEFLCWRALKVVEPGGTFEESESLRYKAGGWERANWYRGQASAPYLLALGQDRFLAVDVSGKQFKDGDQPVPFAILKANEKGELKVQRCFDAELEKPFFTKAGKRNYPSLLLDFIHFSHARTPDYLVLGSVYGVFWIIDVHKARLKRVVRLFSGLQDIHLERGELIIALHGLQPRPDGHVLISSRTEDALLWARVGKPRPAGVGGEVTERLRQWSDDLNKRHPHVAWWDLDPETGKIYPEAPPLNFPDRLDSDRAAMDFNWRFKPDGNLEVLSLKEWQGNSEDPVSGLRALFPKASAEAP